MPLWQIACFGFSFLLGFLCCGLLIERYYRKAALSGERVYFMIDNKQKFYRIVPSVTSVHG